MSIFANNNMVASEIYACEGYDIATGGNYDAIMESYDDDMAVIEAMHAFEMAELEAMKESGSENVSTPLMEASLKEIWAKIKEFFVNLGKRILGFFRSVIDYINSIVLSGTDFAKKYKERLAKVSLKNFKYEMYEYTIVDEFKKGHDSIGKYEDLATASMNDIRGMDIKSKDIDMKFIRLGEEYDKSHEDTLKALRKLLSGEEKEENFAEGLFKRFRGGDDKKKEIAVSGLGKYVTFLEKSEGLLKSAKSANNAVKNTFANIEKIINTEANNAEKASKSAEGRESQILAKKAALMRKQLKTFSAIQSLGTRFINAWSSATKEAVSTYKALCFKALTHKG